MLYWLRLFTQKGPDFFLVFCRKLTLLFPDPPLTWGWKLDEKKPHWVPAENSRFTIWCYSGAHRLNLKYSGHPRVIWSFQIEVCASLALITQLSLFVGCPFPSCLDPDSCWRKKMARAPHSWRNPPITIPRDSTWRRRIVYKPFLIFIVIDFDKALRCARQICFNKDKVSVRQVNMFGVPTLDALWASLDDLHTHNFGYQVP